MQARPEATEQPAQEVSIVQKLSRWYRSVFVRCLSKSSAGPLSSVAAGVVAVDAVVAEAAVVADAVVAVENAVAAVENAVVAEAAVVEAAVVAEDDPVAAEAAAPKEEEDLYLSTPSSELTTLE
jgi:hypothetical protein